MSNFRRVKNSHALVTPVKNYFDFSHVWQIRTNCEEFARTCHTCEELFRIFHICDKYVRLLHMCERFVRMWKSNESVTSVKMAFFLRATPQKYAPFERDRLVTDGYRQRSREPKCQINHLTRILLLLAQLHTETIKVGEFRSTAFNGSRGNAITSRRIERFTKSELGAKNMKLVDRPEFGLVLAQLDIEASLIGKFHSNPPSRSWGDAITRNFKDGRRRPFFFFFFLSFFVLVQLYLYN